MMNFAGLRHLGGSILSMGFTLGSVLYSVFHLKNLIEMCQFYEKMKILQIWETKILPLKMKILSLKNDEFCVFVTGRGLLYAQRPVD